MKQLFWLSVIIILSILISCGDIVDADKNIDKNQITYNYVLKDQENGVIMPLKVGNKWVYKVTEVDTNFTIQKLYYDSIKVLNEENVNGEKWFRVYCPMLSEQPVLMTNTDAGLVYKFDKSQDGNSLLALYPVKTNQYTSHIQKVIFIDSNTQGRPIEKEIDAEMLTTIKQNESVVFGGLSYNSILYSRTLRSNEYSNYFDKYSMEYQFVPDYGPFRIDIFRNYSKYYLLDEKFYDLVYYSGLNGGSLFQNYFVIDFGSIKLGNESSLIVQNIIQNNTQHDVIIKRVTIFSDNSFTLINDISNTVLNSGTSVSLTINCRPKALGHFESIMTIETDNGSYDFLLKYDSIQ